MSFFHTLFISLILDIVSLKESDANKENFYYKLNKIYRDFIQAKSECLFHNIEYNTVVDPDSAVEVTEISCLLTLLPNQCLIIPELLLEEISLDLSDLTVLTNEELRYIQLFSLKKSLL